MAGEEYGGFLLKFPAVEKESAGAFVAVDLSAEAGPWSLQKAVAAGPEQAAGSLPGAVQAEPQVPGEGHWLAGVTGPEHVVVMGLVDLLETSAGVAG